MGYWLAAPGVDLLETLKSFLLLSVSTPFGRRAIELPGSATVGGLGAGVPSVNVFGTLSVSYATVSTSTPFRSRIQTAPHVAERPLVRFAGDSIGSGL